MKLTRGFLVSSLVLVSTSLPSHADYFWDGTDTTADADGGAGVWDTSALNWDTLATGGTNTAWANAQNAVFGGTAGNVLVTSAGITAAGLTFNTSGYQVQNNFLTLGSGSINTAPGISATVQSYLTGSGLIKTGTGTLTVSGTNTYGGATVISAGTLKPAAVPSSNTYRYYRFTVFTNGGDGYNQIAELHYYKSGLWIPAVAGSAAPQNGASGSEQFWGNANDNKGSSTNHTKFGVNTRPYSLTYDFGAPTSLDAYNWATGNDSTPGRNPVRWTVSGSNDGTNFTILDDRSGTNQAGPTTTFTWSATNTTYVTNDNSANIGAANAYPLGLGYAIPSGSALQIAAGATLDVNGFSSLPYASLEDSAGAGGTVTNGLTSTPTTFRVGAANTNTTFTGVITDTGVAGAVSVLKIGSGAQTLAGAASNTYSGTTTIGGTGKLVLAKTGGAIAIPGNITLASSTWNGQNSGIVLALDEQIANTAVLTWPNTNAAGGPQSDSFFRPNGHTETIGGLVSSGSGGLAIIENRGSGDAATYGTGTVIINVANAGTTYSFNGGIRNMDGGTGGGTVAITKTGPGTQVLSGGMGSATGPGIVNDGILRVNNTWGAATMTVTGTGILQGSGGNMSGPITVQSGGTFAPGSGGAGTFTANTAVTIGSGGTLSLAGTGTLAGVANINSGGTMTGTGTVTGAVSVLSGGQLTPGAAGIGTIKTNSSLSLAGNVTMEINKSGANLTNDQVSGFSSVNYGGTLTIVATGDTPVLGDSFQLFVPGAGGTYAGGFTGITGLPALSGGLQWETTALLTTGRINVVNNVSTPSFSPAAGGYVGAQSVTITSDSGSTIHYTTDGSTPTLSSPSGPSPVTGINIPVDSVTTLRAYATKSGSGDSPIATAVYRTVTVPKWNVDNIGDWSTATNWLNQVIPSGSGVTADFTFPQSAPTAVNLDSNRSVGSLVFGNTSGFAWTLSTANSSILTLAVPSGTPSVAVNDVDTTISTVVAGSQGLVKTGAGMLVLSATNSYLGNTAINGGTLRVTATAPNGTSSPMGAGSTLSFDGGTLLYSNASSNNFNREITLNAGGGTVDVGTDAGFMFIAGPVSGNGTLTKKGTRQLIISGTNSYTGDTFLTAGETQIRTVDALGTTAGKTVVSNGARLCAGGGFTGTINENIELSGMGGNDNGALQSNDGGTTVTYAGAISLVTDSGFGGGQAFGVSGVISGNGGLTKVTGNNLTLSGGSSNTFTGATTLGGLGRITLAKTGGAIAIPGNINMSTTGFTAASGLNLAGDEQIADTSIITWTPNSYGGGARSNSYFNLQGHTETVGGLVSTGNTAGEAIQNRGYQDTTSFGMGTLIINATGNYTYNTTIRDFDAGTGGGSVAITKTGPGTQTLSGAMSYTGPTTVAAGTLGIETICNSPITVLTGGTLQGFGGTNSTLVVNAGGTLTPGNATGTGTFSGNDVTVAGKLKLRIDGVATDGIVAGNNLDITGGSLEFSVVSAPTETSYIIGRYTGTLTGTFTVTGLPSGYAVVYDTSNSEIRIEGSGATGYAAFAASNGLTGSPGADFDKDGIADGVEYVLGTSPTAPNGGAPAGSVSGGNLVFTFQRADSSMTPDVAVSIEVGSTLVAWPSVYQVGADTASSSPGVTVTDNGATDTITLTVPQAPDAKKFAHLKVVVTP